MNEYFDDDWFDGSDDYDPAFWYSMRFFSKGRKEASFAEYCLELAVDEFGNPDDFEIGKSGKLGSYLSITEAESNMELLKIIEELYYNNRFVSNLTDWEYTNNKSNSTISVIDAITNGEIIWNLYIRTYDLDSAEELLRLGIENITDIPGWVTVYDLRDRVIEYYRNCKLTKSCCEEILLAVSKYGTVVEMPKDCVPNASNLPGGFMSWSPKEYEMERAQMRNFFDWRIGEMTIDDFVILKEKGEVIESSKKQKSAHEKNVTQYDVYPMNLLVDIFGCEIPILFLDEYQMQKLEQIVEVHLEELIPQEKRSVDMAYKNGITVGSALRFFELPEFETFAWALADRWGMGDEEALPRGIKRLQRAPNRKLLRWKIADALRDLRLCECDCTKVMLEDLGLSKRTLGCLKRVGMNTVKDILDKTEDDLMNIKRLGSKSLNEIVWKLVSLGYKI